MTTGWHEPGMSATAHPVGPPLAVVAHLPSGSAIIGRALFMRHLGRRLQFATPLYE